MKKRICILLFILMMFLLSGCRSMQFPREGTWHCPELGVQISFEDKVCFAIRNGQKIECDCMNDRGSAYFSIVSQAYDIEEHPLGTILFSGVIIHLEEGWFLAQEETTGIIYEFVSVASGIALME